MRSPRLALVGGRALSIVRWHRCDAATTSETAAAQEDIAGTFDIGGRNMYIQCTGQGSPTVVLISGGGIAADLWDSPLGEQPTVYPTIAKTAGSAPTTGLARPVQC